MITESLIDKLNEAAVSAAKPVLTIRQITQCKDRDEMLKIRNQFEDTIRNALPEYYELIYVVTSDILGLFKAPLITDSMSDQLRAHKPLLYELQHGFYVVITADKDIPSSLITDALMHKFDAGSKGENVD